MPPTRTLFLVITPTDDATAEYVQEVLSTMDEFLQEVPSVLITGTALAAELDEKRGRVRAEVDVSSLLREVVEPSTEAAESAEGADAADAGFN